MKKKPKALLTNDDGIDCGFLHALAKAMREDFEVAVAAPKNQRSWTGRAVSRHQPVAASLYEGLDCPAWAIDGTPTDAVNIALAHLLKEKPDVVLSGINIGYNTTLNLILCSGTVAGALEGACWGIPALALSLVVPRCNYEEIREKQGFMGGETAVSLETAARRSVGFAKELAGPSAGEMIVHNINFPMPVRDDTPVEHTIPAKIFLGGLFKPENNSHYNFELNPGRELPSAQLTDRQCLAQGKISRTLLDFSKIPVITESQGVT